jgi:hypothetical protein
MTDVNNIIQYSLPTLGLMEMVVPEVHSLRQIVTVYVHLGIVILTTVTNRLVPEELIQLTIIVQVLVKLGIVVISDVHLN